MSREDSGRRTGSSALWSRSSFSCFAGSDLIQSLERKAYDLGVRATTATPSRPHRGHRDRRREHRQHRPLAVAARRAREDDRQARGRRRRRSIGNTVFFFEPQVDPGPRLRQQAARRIREGRARPAGGRGGLAASPRWARCCSEAEVALNTDRKLAAELQEGRQRAAADALRARRAARQARQAAARLRHAQRARRAAGRRRAAVPTRRQRAGARSSSIGAAGAGRRPPERRVRRRRRRCAPSRWCCSYYDQLFPSLSVMIAAKSLNLGAKDIKVDAWARASRSATCASRTDAAARRCTPTSTRIATGARPSRSTRSSTSTRGKIPAAKYRDKIVLIGATAAGLGTTPGDAGLAGDGAGADARALGVVDPAGALLRRARLGRSGSSSARLPARRRST